MSSSTILYPFSSFFFNDTATTEIYTSVHTLSLHDALPISVVREPAVVAVADAWGPALARRLVGRSEEHTSELQSRTLISYAVFCLKKKKKKKKKKNNGDHMQKKKKIKQNSKI